MAMSFTQTEIALIFFVFVLGIVVGRITMAFQIGFMKQQAKRMRKQ